MRNTESLKAVRHAFGHCVCGGGDLRTRSWLSCEDGGEVA